MINKKYGDLGLFVIPVAIISIFLAITVTIYLLFKIAFDVRREIEFLQNVNFDFLNLYEFNAYIVERVLYHLVSNPTFLFIGFFMIILICYLYYAQKKVGGRFELLINVPIFFAFFAILFSFWWIVSIFYAIFFKSVKWR